MRRRGGVGGGWEVKGEGRERGNRHEGRERGWAGGSVDKASPSPQPKAFLVNHSSVLPHHPLDTHTLYTPHPLHPPYLHAHRLQQLSQVLCERESELDKLHEQLQGEVAAASSKAAAQQAELAGERSLLAKQGASLEAERQNFKAWMAERKEELAQQHKVGGLVGWLCMCICI